MKNFKYLLFALFISFPFSVKADHLYSVDMDVYLEKDGTASIIETWDVKADSGTEWYKQYMTQGNNQVYDLTVSMDNVDLKEKTWDINETISEKAGYYGLHKIDDGIEICFGKKDFNRHTFIMKYKMTNYIFNVSDNQVLYQTMFPNLTADRFYVTISSYYDFPDDLPVWGYGGKGLAYVKNGKIEMSNEEGDSINDGYVVILAKFPAQTFETSFTRSEFSSFDSVLENSKKGSYKIDYNKTSIKDTISDLLPLLLYIGIPLVGVLAGISSSKTKGYGYAGNKKIDKKEVPMFREIPCNKDIHYGNALMKLNNFGYKEANILGAIILKWVREDKITLKNEKKGIFNKNTSSIDLTKEVTFDNRDEEDLFFLMRAASGDGILEAKELERWARNNYTRYLNIFNNLVTHNIESLRTAGHIHTRTSKEECKQKNVMDDTIYKDSTELYGLKKFLEEFARMDEKETMEVKVWDEYLMFAYLFGIADKVAKQLKNLYPEYVQSLEDRGLDFGTLMFIDHISTTSVNAASSARMDAESYSAGGGGFMSGGGGSGAGGFGGSMGGR